MKERATTSCWSGRRPRIREVEKAGEEEDDREEAGLGDPGLGEVREGVAGVVGLAAEEEGRGRRLLRRARASTRPGHGHGDRDDREAVGEAPTQLTPGIDRGG